MAVLLQSLLYLTRLPVSTRLLIPVNMFWTFWVFFELVDAYFVRKDTFVGDLDFVTILPGSALAWTLLSASSVIRKQNSYYSLILMLAFPLVIFISVMVTSLVDPVSSLGISQLDFSTVGSAIGSLVLSAVLFVPYLILGAVPFGISWVVWLVNLFDSTYLYLQQRQVKRT